MYEKLEWMIMTSINIFYFFKHFLQWIKMIKTKLHLYTTQLSFFFSSSYLSLKTQTKKKGIFFDGIIFYTLYFTIHYIHKNYINLENSSEFISQNITLVTVL